VSGVRCLISYKQKSCQSFVHEQFAVSVVSNSISILFAGYVMGQNRSVPSYAAASVGGGNYGDNKSTNDYKNGIHKDVHYEYIVLLTIQKLMAIHKKICECIYTFWSTSIMF
jgi:hypothetical protein